MGDITKRCALKKRKKEKKIANHARGRRKVRETGGLAVAKRDHRRKKPPPFLLCLFFLSFYNYTSPVLNSRNKKLTPIQSSFNLLLGTICMTTMFTKNMIPKHISSRILLLPTRASVDFAMIPYSITAFFPSVFVLVCACAARFY